MLRAVSGLVLLFVAVSAHAAPLVARNGSAVRVRVNGNSKPGLQLRSEEAGWRLKLDGGVSLLRLSVIDVTPGTPAQTLVLKVTAGEAIFDTVRFHGGHVYRIWSGVDAAAYIYLQPTPAMIAQPKTGPGRVVFDPGDNAIADETGIEPAKKGSL